MTDTCDRASKIKRPTPRAAAKLAPSARRAKVTVPAAMPPQAEPQDGLGYGLRIHRYTAPRDWPRELEKVPDEHRPRAEEYLRGMAARMRHLKRLAQAAGFDSIDAWRAARGGH